MSNAILREQIKGLPQVALLRLFPTEWLGQGWGYKLNKNWEDMEIDEVIYVPEYGYEWEQGSGLPFNDSNTGKTGEPMAVSDLYTKKDFIDIAGNDMAAQILFDLVDWQSPETLHDVLNDTDEEYSELVEG